jgi:predicted small lipoprotein YifL
MKNFVAAIALLTLCACGTKPAPSAPAATTTAADHSAQSAPVGSDGCPATEPAVDSACSAPVEEPNIGCGYPPQAAGAIPHHCLCSQSKWACYPEPAPENP